MSAAQQGRVRLRCVNGRNCHNVSADLGVVEQEIIQALRMKQLPPEAIETGLEAIDEDEYGEGLRQLLRQKSKGLKAANDYERRNKLLRFALGKGYSMDEVLRHVKELEADEWMD